MGAAGRPFPAARKTLPATAWRMTAARSAGSIVFWMKRDRTSGERGVDRGRIVAAREDDRLDRGVALAEQLEATKAVHARHSQIEEHDVR